MKNTYTATQLNENEYQSSFHTLVQRGFNQKRSGDVVVSREKAKRMGSWEKMNKAFENQHFNTNSLTNFILSKYI